MRVAAPNLWMISIRNRKKHQGIQLFNGKQNDTENPQIEQTNTYE